MAAIQSKEELEKFLCENWDEIQEDISRRGSDLPLPLYTSVDVREAIHKFAPVDNNLYPAGFNNLCSIDLGHAGEKIKSFILKRVPNAKWIGILAESHTKNGFYLDHLLSLRKALRGAGLEVIVGSPDEELFVEGGDFLELNSQSLGSIEVERFAVENNIFKAVKSNRKLDFIVMNNDQSRPLPINWAKIETPVHPSPFMGWYRREKIRHFQHYHQVVEDFCQKYSINPSLLRAEFDYATNIDFNTKEGLEALASKVDALIARIGEGKKVFVKASQGTYGMGISVVGSGAEILEMNRKIRNKMDVGKNNLKFTSVLIQEGVETIVKFEDGPAEVTIYLVGSCATGGFIRANPLRDSIGNLNAKGMIYQKYCIADLRQGHDFQSKQFAYTLVGRLSSLAAGLEIKESINSNII